MKAIYIYTLICSFIALSCAASKTTATPEQIHALDQLVTGQSFIIESEWALPQTTTSLMALQNSGLLAPGNSMSRISLIGNSNDLVIKNDSVTSKLPYFGERQMTSGYNGSDSAIEFDGPFKNYKVSKNDNSGYTIEFEARSHNEKFDVTILLYPNLRSEVILQGSKRFSIRYTGHVAPISE